MAVAFKKEENTFSIGMLLGLSCWGLIFLTLVWGYLVFRLRLGVWFADFFTQDVYVLAIFNTVLIALSFLLLRKAYTKSSIVALWTSIALGMVFLFGQINLWKEIIGVGLHWQDSHAGSFFFLLTGFHALHVVGGLAALIAVAFQFSEHRESFAGRGVKYFWDFLFYIWICMFILIFIVR